MFSKFNYCMNNNTCLIYCHCGAGLFTGEELQKLEQALKKYSIDVFELHDLCALSINEKEFLNSVGKNYEQKIIIACYPRAIKNMLAQNNIDFGVYEVLNFREASVEQITEKLESDFKIAKGTANYKIKKSELGVPGWYPVIDHSLCTLCGQCSRFCLFGVYRYDKKSLKVVDPLACKDNCPACGRTCPVNAIIFPRLPENSVLSGADPNKTPVTFKLDGGGGLFEQLNTRNRNRKNIFRQGLMMQAEEERKKALADLKMGLKKKK